MGLGKYSWYLVRELQRLGVSVDVFTTDFHQKIIGAPSFFLKNAFLNLRSYDIVHSSEGAGLLVAHDCMVETYHHYYKQTFNMNSVLFSYMESFQCKKSKRIIVPSFRTKEDLVNKEGCSERKIDVIYHGVDTKLFKPDLVSRNLIRKKYELDDSFVVISVGRLVYHKRHVDILEALSKIPESVFLLVGAGSEEMHIKNRAKELGVKLLHFKNISDEELVNLYNCSDVYAHASVVEGFGLTILEAMACSLPIVCYDVADLRSIVSDAGYLLQPMDVTAMANAFQSIKSENNSIRELGKIALNRSKAYTWEKTAAEHLKVYKSIIESV